MARGGRREGAGRKADPNSARQKALARKAAKAAGQPVVKRAEGRGYTLANGQKAPDAPPGWPFGTEPPAAAAPPAPDEPQKRQTAREFLGDLVNDRQADAKLRLDAAKKLIEFEEAKPAPQGKKEAKQQAAQKASRFAAAAPPRLAAAGGKRVS